MLNIEQHLLTVLQEETFSPAQPAEVSRFGSPELQAMIIARCVEKDQAGFLSGNKVSDEALRKFVVVASRCVHDARAALQAQLEFFIEQEKDALNQYRYFVANNRPELKNYWRNQMSSLHKKRAKVVRMLTMFKGL